MTYLLIAATTVSIPSVVANQLGIRIGDLSYFQDEDEPPPPPKEAEQLVSYEEALSRSTSTEPTPQELEEFAPFKASYGRSYVALPDPIVMSMRGKLVAMQGGDKPAKKTAGGH
ncbi:hypothetical protein [Pseudooceanicola sp. MF1-13]|uniref:hypothetical protein n=1 Tax=Pseudooceanicola sp. MF1-13 TaxID=3379095 RepID=UPI003891711C